MRKPTGKPHDLRTDHPWGTWEELLLASAVNRHGKKSWDSVAMELQTRSSSPLLLNAHNCRNKYYELERRFMAVDAKSNGQDDESPSRDESTIPWLGQLRNLRVAELRRELQRSDLSIVSLQQKVKKLKEDREQSLKEEGKDEEKSDLEKDSKKTGGGGEEERDGESEKSSPVNHVEKRIPGDESDHEDRSFNESNFTDPKGKSCEIEPEPGKKQEEAAETDSGKTDPRLVGGEGSHDVYSDNTAKAAVAGDAATVPVPNAGDSAEFRESVAESKGEGGQGAAKESSDVQSSASLSRKRRRTKEVPASSSGDEPDADEVSPAKKRVSVKSQRLDRLARLLEVIRSHKNGSVFDRRLKIQESVEYRKVIRQHVDLETIKMKLEQGLYSNSRLQFFRDLLLLFNNAIVFFPKNSPESTAAISLRENVSKEMKTTRSRSKPILTQKQNPPSKKSPFPPIQSLPKPNNTPSSPLPSKPNPIVASRKRSSISAKASQLHPPVESRRNKPGPDPNEPDDDPPASLSKRKTRERWGFRTKGARDNKRGRSSKESSNNKNSVSKAGSSSKEPVIEEKTEKKKKESGTVKKQDMANFLNRMKRSTSSSSLLLDSLKEESVSGRGRGEQKKRGRSGGDGRRDQGLRRGDGRKQSLEQSGLGRRTIGRPPKRAAPPLKTPPSTSRKARERVEVEGKPSRKRPRR